MEDIHLLEEDGKPAVFDRYSNSFLKIYFEIPEGREDEMARKVLMKHLIEGNSYGIQLKEQHAKFAQPELGPWVEGSETVGSGWTAPDARGLGEARRALSVTTRPIVGISEGFADYGDYYGFGYGRPLLAAGALPVLLPYYERAEDRGELIERLDGLVLAGGRDIEAWRYRRAEPHPKHLPGLPHLDEIELHYARTRGRGRCAVARGLPRVPGPERRVRRHAVR